MVNQYRIYFLSTGRTGTTFLYQFYNNIAPNLSITHQQNGSRLMNIIGNILLINKKYYRFIKSFYKLILKVNSPCSTVDPLQSIAIYLYLKSNEIKNVKIIHVVRDPRDFVASFMNWSKYSITKIILHNFIPFWKPSPIFNNSTDIPKPKNKFEKFCWVWSLKNGLFESLQNNNIPILTVRFEDIVNKKLQIKTLQIINHFIGVEVDDEFIVKHIPQKVNESINKTFLSWRNWTNSYVEFLNKYCNNDMQKYGYGNEKEWKKN